MARVIAVSFNFVAHKINGVDQESSEIDSRSSFFVHDFPLEDGENRDISVDSAQSRGVQTDVRPY